jgi:single-strand selective monofunctional uracil DNA glycosylase
MNQANTSISDQVQRAARALAQAVDRQALGPPVAFVYNPLSYAWTAHARYIERFATAAKEVIFLGMNPGPFGMIQTGVPFGEVAAVRDWLGIEETVSSPARMHPKRRIEGFGPPALGTLCPALRQAGRVFCPALRRQLLPAGVSR